MPQLSTRIVGGLGVLLLSPTLLTAAERYREELADSPAEVAPRQKSGPRSALWGRSNLRTRVAVTASGLVAATSVAYTAPGTPWAQADVFSASAVAAEPATGPATAPGNATGHGTGTGTGTGHTGTGTGTGSAATGQGTESTSDAMAHDQATYSGVVRTPDRTFLVDATPVRAGNNTLAVTVINADSAPADVKQWTATASLPGTADVPVPLKAFGDGVAAADAVLPVEGQWTLNVTVRVAGATAPISFSQAIPITK